MKKIMIFILMSICIVCSGCSIYGKMGEKRNKSNNLAYLLMYYINPITNLTSMQAVIDAGANIDEVVDSSGNKESILNEAITSGNKEAVKLLIENGADVNYTLKDGSTNLFHAVYKQDRELVDLLLKNGADIYRKNKDGYNVLDLALLVCDEEMLEDYKDTKEMIKFLEDKGLQLSSNSIKALLKSSADGDIKYISYLGMIKYVINKLDLAKKDTGLDEVTKNIYFGNSEFVQSKITEKYIDGLSEAEKNNLIYASAAFCNVDTIKVLEKYLDITKDNEEGINALFCALAYNTKDVAKYLLCNEFRLNITEAFDTCAINAAILSNDKEKIQMVLDNDGVKVTEDIMFLYPYVQNKEISELFRVVLEDKDDESMYLDGVIDDCIIEENKVAIDNIVKYVPEEYIKDICVGSALYRPMNIDMIYYAMDKLKIDCKEELLYSAVKYDNTELVERLVEEGTDIDASEAIAIAIEKGDMDMIKFLVGKGADLDIEIDDGYGLVELAKDSNYTNDVAEYIRDNKK